MRPNESDHNQPNFDPNSWPWGSTQPNLTLFRTLRVHPDPKSCSNWIHSCWLSTLLVCTLFEVDPIQPFFNPEGPTRLIKPKNGCGFGHSVGHIPTVQPNYNWFRRPCYMKEWLLKMYDLWFHGRNAGQSVPKIGCKLIGGFDFKPKPLGGRCRDH